MPSANDLGFARSQDISFKAFLVVLVVLGSKLTHVIPADLLFETGSMIWVAVSMIVADLMSLLHSTMTLSLSSSSQYSALWYAFGSIAPRPPPTPFWRGEGEVGWGFGA